MRRSRPARAGMTLIEIMVVITIIVIVTGVSIPSMALLLDLRQKEAADTLATTFAYLRDEATLRNVTFRLAFNLDRNTWKVEAGSPDARIFETPEERIAWEKEVGDRMARYTDRELQEGAADELLEQTGRFEGLTDVTLDTNVELPGGSVFAWAYTPEYADPVQASLEMPEDPAAEQVVYSYIFPDGQMELTVIRIVGERDPEDGYTLIVEPLTGRIHITSEDTDYRDAFSWIPTQGPELPS
jgi:prepilin-type N-terminal cleavage/methylation domain-containing protein